MGMNFIIYELVSGSLSLLLTLSYCTYHVVLWMPYRYTLEYKALIHVDFLACCGQYFCCNRLKHSFQPYLDALTLPQFIVICEQSVATVNRFGAHKITGIRLMIPGFYT